jgi:hypothetical protein
MGGEELHTVEGRSDPKTKRGEPMGGGREDTKKKIVFRLQDVSKM